MKKIILLLTITFSLSISAQDVISNAGGEGQNVVWTIGEVVTETIIGDAIFTQGFNQPTDGFTSGIEMDEFVVEFKAYPNPVSDQLYVNFPNMEKYTWQLTDLFGRKLLGGTSTEDQMIINVAGYAAGQYIFTVTSAKATKSVIIIKK